MKTRSILRNLLESPLGLGVLALVADFAALGGFLLFSSSDDPELTAAPTAAEPAARTEARLPLSASSGQTDARLTETSSETVHDSSFTLDAAKAEVVTTDGAVMRLESTEGLFERVFIPMGEPVTFRVSVPRLVAGAEVSIAAPNGGSLRWLDGPMKFKALGGAEELEFELAPTLGRGAYNVTIRQSGSVATLNFWAGELNPAGQPGPAYVQTNSTDISSSPNQIDP